MKKKKIPHLPSTISLQAAAGASERVEPQISSRCLYSYICQAFFTGCKYNIPLDFCLNISGK